MGVRKGLEQVHSTTETPLEGGTVLSGLEVALFSIVWLVLRLTVRKIR